MSYQLPNARKTYAPLIASKIVSVQPLLGPTGLIYYLRHKYAQNKGLGEFEEQAKKKTSWLDKVRSIDEPWEV